MIKEVQIPLQEPKILPSTFIKLGKRRAACLSIASVAVALALDGEKIKKTRIALGAVAPVPMRAKAAEMFLEENPLTEDSFEKAADLAAGEADPITDIRASREYRLEMCRVLVKRGIQQARTS
jgi:carbon-monoxide dehydrogenase medium subunit